MSTVTRESSGFTGTSLRYPGEELLTGNSFVVKTFTTKKRHGLIAADGSRYDEPLKLRDLDAEVLITYFGKKDDI